MSKCSVLRTLKSKCSHCTLLRPKYCAFSDVEANRRKRKATASLRIESTSPFENSESSVAGRAAKLLPRPERNATPQIAAGCCEEVNGRDLSPNLLAVERFHAGARRGGERLVLVQQLDSAGYRFRGRGGGPSGLGHLG